MHRMTRPPASSRPHRHRLAWLLIALFVWTACGTPPAAEPPAPPAATYETRGVIRKLPPNASGGELLVAHESIPTFADQDGETVGMPAMTMPFLVTDPTLLTSVAVGDRVALTFGVRWSDGPPLEILSVTPLAADVRLDFEQEEGIPEDSDPAKDEDPAEGEGS